MKTASIAIGNRVAVDYPTPYHRQSTH